MPRESVTLTEKMSEQIARYAEFWGVSKGEAMRRLFGMGIWVAETTNKEKRDIYLKDQNGQDEKIVFNLNS